MRYLVICKKCGKEIREVTAEYLKTYYRTIHTDSDWNVSWAEENWKGCQDCLDENSIVRQRPSKKDLRHITTKDDRENRHRINNYKRKKAEARYQKERYV